MCWVAVDRGLRLADKRSLPCPDRMDWLRTRDEIYEAIMEKGYNTTEQTFTQSFEGRDAGVLDAAVLIMPLVLFSSPTDPRMLNTIKAISRPIEQGGLCSNGLVNRYNFKLVDDGFDHSEEGSFSMCTFWLIEALTRSGKNEPQLLETAATMFEMMLSYGNHLHLFSEQITRSGEGIGNLPQAFTHLSLISAAYNLDRTLSFK
ncbi:hypothetical protein HDU93_003596 [Gonapodya sp. JEL0774]|nr:hypothetical protein HDU93_003596 [Gonapodya sp. JEL0774]